MLRWLAYTPSIKSQIWPLLPQVY
ncbi:hypothetical protein PMIN01_03128 [Paraphaeosphaeria minitans]|uniref:Uncharacterized protein n=1 Tax=Paraphaeosphaeria minitans TaxID=565426 RepID=A0A9P6KT28_9PLEO|nr:hypothetical protein PMIN01_03128 [Paraphaeosphaeria minitans]